jgi:hypothetical protein
MNPRWLLRMRRWVDHPPSKQRMILIAVIIAAGLLIVSLEHWGYWPDWATAERMRRPRF